MPQIRRNQQIGCCKYLLRFQEEQRGPFTAGGALRNVTLSNNIDASNLSTHLLGDGAAQTEALRS